MKRPYMSVVVIVHNGQNTIGHAIESLLRQTYPKSLYEIIVIDDGSTDETPKIVSAYKDVRYRRLYPNQGIPAARNAGLAAVKGDVYVAFDDDCVAEPTWLSQLAKTYSQLQPVGLGGRLVDPRAQLGISDKYITARDGNLLRQSNKTTKPAHGIWRRLINYFSQQPALSADLSQLDYIAVEELYGANSAFPVEVLRAVGGWRPGMNSIEDRDICRRIQIKYPNRQFIVNPRAIITHERGQSLSQYLHRQYKQGPYNLFFYRQHNQLPPVFPTPFLYSLLLGLTASQALVMLPLAVLVLPILLYYWWPVQAFKQRRLLLVSFVFIQLAEESLVILGLLRGLNWLVRRKAIYA
jgi:cellulose synthase/poly-beta-1,6-N-acetylglucosamine synthase-like glycosyltransferase